VKAERYRVLNEPTEAESICLDILEVEPDNQQAIAVLLLALTDQFAREASVEEAKRLLPRLRDPYERAYHAGIIAERHAKARLAWGGPDAEFAAYEWLREAMSAYEEAQVIRPPTNDDSILRWNACARIVMRNPRLRPRPPETDVELPLE
jgi:hypothetical protein